MPNKAWVALGKSLPEFVYYAVEICHRRPLPSVTPGFSLWQKLCKMAKHQRRRSAWVGQEDFRKVEPNNGNHSGNCQRLSVKHDQFETRSIFFKPSCFRYGHRSSEDHKTLQEGELMRHRVIELFFVDVNLAAVKTIGHLFSHRSYIKRKTTNCFWLS